VSEQVRVEGEGWAKDSWQNTKYKKTEVLQCCVSFFSQKKEKKPAFNVCV